MIKKKPIINIVAKKLFTSIVEGADFYGINRNKLSKMCRDKNSEFRFLKHNHGMVLRGKGIKKLHKSTECSIADSKVIRIFEKDELKIAENSAYFGIFKR